MIRPDPEIERKTLALRDAFRVFVWSKFNDYSLSQHPDRLFYLYACYNTLWRESEVVSMDFFQLRDLAARKGLTVETLLDSRKRYYGINDG